MFLKDANGDLVQVMDVQELIDPHKDTLHVRYQAGEELGDPVEVKKRILCFHRGSRFRAAGWIPTIACTSSA